MTGTGILCFFIFGLFLAMIQICGYWIFNFNRNEKKTFIGFIIGTMVGMPGGLYFISIFQQEIFKASSIQWSIFSVLGYMLILGVGWIVGGNIAYSMPRSRCLSRKV